MKTKNLNESQYRFLSPYFYLVIAIQFCTILILSYLILSGSEMTSLFRIFSYIVTASMFLLLIVIKLQLNKMHLEKEKLREEFLSKNGYLELFFKHSKDSIAVFGNDQKLLTINPAFEELYGWDEDEVIGKCVQLMPASEREAANERMKQLLMGRNYKNLRTKEMKKDGTLFDAEITMTPIFNEKKEIIAISVITRDISKRIEAERLKIDAIKLNTIGEIAATVAHEIRNPMTAITGFVQMMESDPSNPYPLYTATMEQEIKRINLITNEFLILSKPNIKQRTEVDIESTLLEIIHLFEEDFKERRIDCALFFAEQRRHVFGNIESLKQVFINLIRNANEAIDRNGSIMFTTSVDGNNLSICMQDNGCGMDNETLDQLFVPFFTTKDNATGLGVVIAKKIIIDHRGTIEVESSLGNGTSVTVTFPILMKQSNLQSELSSTKAH